MAKATRSKTRAAASSRQKGKTAFKFVPALTLWRNREFGTRSHAAAMAMADAVSAKMTLDATDDFFWGGMTDREKEIARYYHAIGAQDGCLEAARKTHQRRRVGRTKAIDKRKSTNAERDAAIKNFHASRPGPESARIKDAMNKFKVGRSTVYNALNRGM